MVTVMLVIAPKQQKWVWVLTNFQVGTHSIKTYCNSAFVSFTCSACVQPLTFWRQLVVLRGS